MMNRKIIISGVLVFLLLALVSCLSVEAETPGLLKNISPQESLALIQKNDKNPDFVLLDVRTPEEFSQGHLRGAVLLNFKAPTFSEALGQLDKHKTYLLYCHSGRRSGETLTIMGKLGFQQVSNMSGGIVGWNENHLPVEK
ncbi:rhodanese-like domain-containing protein [Deltaproteobacteria bacterium TL4]